MHADNPVATTSLSETLKVATAEAHRRAEQSPAQQDLVRGALAEDRLAGHLGQMRHVHATLERLFDTHPAPAAALAWNDDFRHTRRLDVDLRALGLEPAAIPAYPSTRRLIAQIEANVAEDPMTLVGYFYVLEGSMNGNRFIVKALRQTPAAERCNFTYFDPYGDEQRARWADFKARLDAVELQEGQQEMLVAAALGMFDGIAEMSREI